MRIKWMNRLTCHDGFISHLAFIFIATKHYLYPDLPLGSSVELGTQAFLSWDLVSGCSGWSPPLFHLCRGDFSIPESCRKQVDVRGDQKRYQVRSHPFIDKGAEWTPCPLFLCLSRSGTQRAGRWDWQLDSYKAGMECSFYTIEWDGHGDSPTFGFSNTWG